MMDHYLSEKVKPGLQLPPQLPPPSFPSELTASPSPPPPVSRPPKTSTWNLSFVFSFYVYVGSGLVR